MIGAELLERTERMMTRPDKQPAALFVTVDALPFQKPTNHHPQQPAPIIMPTATIAENEPLARVDKSLQQCASVLP